MTDAVFAVCGLLLRCFAGATWAEPQQLQLPQSDAEWKTAIDAYFKALPDNKKPEAVLAFIPDANEFKYSMVMITISSVVSRLPSHSLVCFVLWQIKSLFTVERGIITQCVQSKQLQVEKPAPIAGNCFKQMMAKLGWYSWRVELPACIKEAKVNV